MTDPYNKIAGFLNASPETLLRLEQSMTTLTGHEGVIENIARENDILVERTIAELGLPSDARAENVSSALAERLAHVDTHLFELLGRPEPARMNEVCGLMCETALKAYTPPRGLCIKQDVFASMLERHRPDALLEHFACASVREIIEQEGFAPVASALRFVQSREWMADFFEREYAQLTPDDFEERSVQLHVLDTKWLAVAEKFLERKYHNVSHLKELGIIFIIPIASGITGETIRMFTLILHYLHEVPFYASLFRAHLSDADFSAKVVSLLRGDVSSGSLVANPDAFEWRIVQRYLAKDDPHDPRLAEPHVNPEVEHWFKAEHDLGGLTRSLNRAASGMNLGFWTGLDFAAGIFPDRQGKPITVSFNLMDLILSLAANHNGRYHYHQPEALWNKVFIEYAGREKMNDLIEKNILEGVIRLKDGV